METLTSLITMLAASSLLAVLFATLIERLVPILPSYFLLLSIGIAAARSDSSLITMVAASVIGSVVGCGIYYFAASTIGPARTLRWSGRLARMAGVSHERTERLSDALQRNAASLSLTSQLVPGLRLVAPSLAGAVGIPVLTYFPFAAIGIAIWNLFFLAAGYIAAQLNPQADAASIALTVLGMFLLAQATVGVHWWAWRRYRPAVLPASFPPIASDKSDAKAIVL